ncbi:MAG TPA: hypothetical protein VI076_01595, partial [Actinopolymorphaceae bacterium]
MAQVGRAGIAALAGLLVVDVALVALAFRHVQGGDFRTSGSSALPTVGATTPAAKDPDGEPTEPPEKSEDPEEPAGDYYLIDIGADQAVARAAVGVCGKGGGKVELSLDGGETWKAADLPDAQVILRVASTNADVAQVVAADQNCGQVTTYETANGGGSWESTEGSDGRWHKQSGDTANVHAPSGKSLVPCANGENVVALSTLSGERAYAMCSDGAILGTSDAGLEWEPQGEVSGATDFDYIDPDIALAVAPEYEKCAGVAVLKTQDSGESWEQVGCIETESPGAADISADGDRAYVSIGTQVWFSDDGGLS